MSKTISPPQARLSLAQRLREFLFGTLRQRQRWLHGLFALTFLLITANTLFLLARRYVVGCALNDYDGCAVSIFYQSMVLSHSGIGLLMSLALAGFVALHIARNWKLATRRAAVLSSGLAVLSLLIFLLISGTYFLFRAKTDATMWLFYSHMGAAAVVVALYLLHRHLVRPKHTASGIANLIGAAAVLGAVLVIGEVISAPQTPEPIRAKSLRAEDGSYEPPTVVKAGHPFFPSPVQIASGAPATVPEKIVGQWPEDPPAIRAEVEQKGWADSVMIGAEKCARCHAGVVESWARSVHRFSSFNNPYYIATLDFLRENTPEPSSRLAKHLDTVGIDYSDAGKIKSQWCAGCHDPALMLSGQFRGEIDRGSVAAQAGLTCLACHRISDIPNHTGNGNFVWNDRDQDSYIFSDAQSRVGRKLHDIYLRANPERHKADMLQPFYKQSEFCATCHKVALDEAVNDYRWLRGQNEYDAWHNSGVAHNAARTFYLPSQTRECQACHMPLEKVSQPDRAADDQGRVRSHSFGSVNTALPYIRGDQTMIDEIEAYLQDKKLRIHFAGIRGQEGLEFLSDTPLEAEAGDLELHVVVRNLGVGHTFPGGTNDSNQGWVRLVLRDASGAILAELGRIDENGYAAFDTRFYGAVQVDKHGQMIDKRNAQEMIAPAYVKVLGPGTADTVRFRIPEGLLDPTKGPYRLDAELSWRKFHQAYNSFAFAANPEGFKQFDAPPELPITIIDAAALSITPSVHGYLLATEKPHPQPEIGLHDYAIGFLRQGDTALATQAAEAAVAVNPECWNCRRTEITIALNSGDFAKARELLSALERNEPGNPQTAWSWARLLMQEGRYSRAEQALAMVLSRFPGDREAIKLRARLAYLDQRYEDSLSHAQAALVINPEDATAQYYAMLAAQGLGQNETAEHYKAAFAYHKRDEAAQQVTRAYRETHPDVNFAAQMIQVFELQK